MRELEVLRVESDGRYIVVVDRADDEQFRLRVDDELRAAVRGEAAEMGQLDVTGEAALRPREIQSRIRAGASVAELAEIAGVSPAKIDRYAHPVLLERTRAAELARASHPLTLDGPSTATLGELVAECLVLRGEVPANARWDAWKTEEGQWVVQLAFHEGRTQNWAHWRFQPGTHGGVTDPIDELAIELTEPELARAARRTRLAAVPPAPQPPQRELHPDGYEAVTVDATAVTGPLRTTPSRPAPPAPAAPAPAPAPAAPPVEAPVADVLDLQYASAEPAPAPEAPGPATPEPLAPVPPVSQPPVSQPPVSQPSAPEPVPPAAAEPVAARGSSSPEPAAAPATAPPTPRELAERSRGASRHRAKRGKPAVPAWEDVLLGVRAHPDE